MSNIELKFEFKREIKITIKSKETNNQLQIAFSYQPALATVSSNTYNQMHTQINQSLAHLQV